jgi:hypothetical protein
VPCPHGVNLKKRVCDLCEEASLGPRPPKKVRVSVGEDYFVLDINRLDEEWVAQVHVYHAHATKLADAREAHERAKAAKKVADDDLKHVAAELDLEVRRNPTNFDIEKPTEKAVEHAVLVHKRYRQYQKLAYDAQAEVIRADHEASLLEVACKTLDHKRTALENLVILHGRDYFAAPRDRGSGFNERAESASFKRAFNRRKGE